MNHVLAAFLGLAAILSSAPAEDHVAEYQKILEAWPADRASVDAGDVASGARQLWALLGQRAASILDAEPGLSGDRLAAALLALEDQAGVPSERRALAVSAIELGPASQSAYALAVSHGAVGTVLVVAPTPRGYAIVWSLSDQAEASFARKNRTPLDFQFGAWALGAGKRNSTLGGIVHALPSSPEGHARFYVDAIARAGVGQERQAQISVWEWRDGRVECLDIKSYWTTSTANRIVSDGDVLRVHVLERFKTMYTCGACESAGEIWTLHVKESGISELSRIPLVPELRLVDELLFRLQSHQSVAELAATDVEQRLAPLVADATEPGDAEGFVAMLADWKVTAQGDSTEVELQLDGLPRLAFTIGVPAGRGYVQSVKVLD